MKITLQNFLCYENATFDLGSEGMTLITGMSGCGKTSIMRGIIFAFFGTSKGSTKVQRFGQKSCKVHLEFNDSVTVIRTQCPNYVKVIFNENDQCLLENDEAQDYINRMVGSTFHTSGYIPQHPFRSFIMMSPTDKLEFLEEHTQDIFGEYNPDTIKERANKEISRTKSELNKITGQLEMLIKDCPPKPNTERLKFPVNCSISNRPIVKINRRKRIAKSEKEIDRAMSMLQKKSEELMYARQYTETKLDLTTKISEMEKFFDNNNDMDQLSSKISKAKKDIETIDNIKEACDIIELLEKSKQELSQVETEEKNRLNSCLSELNEKIFDIDQLKQEYKDLKSLLDDARSLESYTETIQELLEPYNSDEDYFRDFYDETKSELVELENEKDVVREKYEQAKLGAQAYQCPSCKVSLNLCDDGLVELDQSIVDNATNILSETKQRLIEIVKRIKVLNETIKESSRVLHTLEKTKSLQAQLLSEYDEEIPSSEDVENQLAQIISTIKDQSSIKKNITQITNELENMTEENIAVKSLYRNILDLENKLNRIEIYNDENFSDIVEHCKTLVKSDLIKFVDENSAIVQDYTIRLENLKYVKKELYSIDKKLENYNLSKLEIEVSELEKKIAKIRSDRDENSETLKKIELWEKSDAEWSSWLESEKKIAELKLSEDIAKKEYTAALELKTKLNQAESVVLDTIVQQIAAHAQQYLDCFFPGGNITIELRTFKESKSTKMTKPKINAVLHYGDITEADIDILSGGETARVILAYTLALGEIFNTPILMLDESTASLDEELTTEVFDTIREHTANKLVIVVAHQVITGTFDRTIKL